MEIVAGAVMRTVLTKLGALLTGEYNLQKSLRGQIMFLIAELESMQAALERVSEAPVVDKQVRIWAGDVRDLSYDIEDSIDKFVVRAATHPQASRPRGLGGFISRSLKLLTTARIRHRIATDIKCIRSRVQEASERRDRYKVLEHVVVVQPMDTRLHGIYEESRRLVAIDGPREELAELLMEGEGKHRLKVISVVGFGGLGKTTLANAVYRQHKGHFDCSAFVTVSLKPDLRRILSSLLRQVSTQNYGDTGTWDVVELVEKIRQVLQDMRYFIVIDDLWDESVWNLIKCALVENNCSSRIVTTTRIAAVAASCCSSIDGTVYKLKPLSRDDSKKLFYGRIFGCEDGCHPELIEISEKILKKCDGVPLAIITIASLIANKPRNINQWNSVHNSIGSGLEKCQNMENMRHILSLSYYDLPAHLKPCFLYLSVFPEDYNISSDQLVRRWIAEGFIHGSDASNLYKQGLGYFNDLINRSMIQPQHMDDHGRIEACHVHDMVLDLITSLSNEENFVTSLDSHMPRHDLPKKIRRLSLQNNEEEQTMPLGTIGLSHVRSLIVFPSAIKLVPPLSSFQILRVLDFEGCRDLDNHHIHGVGNLFHLRYLGLKDTNITNLPKEIGNLHCLKTLDLSHTGITDLPSTIVQLRQLVFLYIERSVKLPHGIGKMESLQVLSNVGVSNSPKLSKDLGSLTELRVLRISFDETWNNMYNKQWFDSFSNLSKITDLHINSFRVPIEFIADLEWVPRHLQNFGGWVPRLPIWINSSLLDLSILNMTLHELRQEDIEVLGALPFLQYLYLGVLENNCSDGKLVISTEHAKFQCLSVFRIKSDAMGLMFAQGAMPALETLEVKFSVRETKHAYGDFDLGMENINYVRVITVKIRCTGSKACEVQVADAAIRKAANTNPNRPMLNIIRYYEDEMVDDQEKFQLDNETFNEEKIVLQRIGPWGGNTGHARDIMLAPQHLKSVIIWYGDIVDALAFSYLDRSGNQHTTPLWGGIGGTVRTIILDQSEFLIEISGTIGPYHLLPSLITSLTLVSNICSYGPFGQPHGTPFHTRVKKNGNIVGFFGRSGEFLDAIGVYVQH